MKCRSLGRHLFLFFLAAVLLTAAFSCTAHAEKAPGETAEAVYNVPELKDGNYTSEVILEGGSGRASIESPAHILVKDGKLTARIVWSSSNYDYMVCGGEMFYPLKGEKTSVFEIPIPGFDAAVPVTADTTAMSMPHEIDYTLIFDAASLKGERSESRSPGLPAALLSLMIGLVFGYTIRRKFGR